MSLSIFKQQMTLFKYRALYTSIMILAFSSDILLDVYYKECFYQCWQIISLPCPCLSVQLPFTIITASSFGSGFTLLPLIVTGTLCEPVANSQDFSINICNICSTSGCVKFTHISNHFKTWSLYGLYCLYHTCTKSD